MLPVCEPKLLDLYLFFVYVKQGLAETETEAEIHRILPKYLHLGHFLPEWRRNALK